MHSETVNAALSRCLQLLEQPAAVTNSRAEFEAGFAAALLRLEAAGENADGRRVDSLLSALGAAAVEQWELALAFVAASARTAPVGAAPVGPESDRRSSRRASVPVGTLRRRFIAVIHQGKGAVAPPAR